MDDFIKKLLQEHEEVRHWMNQNTMPESVRNMLERGLESNRLVIRDIQTKQKKFLKKSKR